MFIASALAGAAATAVVGSVVNRKANKAAERANNAAADAASMQAEIASDQWNRYKEIYEPLEKGLVSEAQNYDSPENFARAAGDASATVSSQFSKARDRLARTPGLDPSTPGYSANLMGLELAQAATDATQQNAARQKVRDTAYARKTDALSLGKGLPASASSMLATSGRSNLSLADSNLDQSMRTSGAIGRVADRVFSSPTVSNWLGNVGVKAGTAMNLQNNGGFGTGNEYGNQDIGQFI